MGRKRSRQLPKYGLHRGSGQGRVRIGNKTYYCGKWGTPEARERYEELIKEHCLSGQEPITAKRIDSLLLLWWTECKERYPKSWKTWKPVIKLLRTHFGDQKADQLGPKALREAIESEAKKHDWSLSYARDVLGKTKLFYHWLAEEEHVDERVYFKIKNVARVRKARRGKPKPPVAEDLVNKTLPHMSDKLAAMVQLQLLLGCRPGELLIMREQDIDRTEDVWTYTPSSHKTEHRGKSREIPIGPKAQAILAKWLLKCTGEYVFSTQRSNKYTVDAYRFLIAKACQRGNLPKWSPVQLRKAAATRIRKLTGPEEAQLILGHSNMTTTLDHYADRDRQKARTYVLKHG